MTRLFITAILAVFMLISAVSPAVAAENTTAAGKKISVATTYYFLAELANRLGGGTVEAVNIVPAGADPHMFEPKPGDIARLTQSDAVLIIGAGMEKWLQTVLRDLPPGREIVDLSAGINLIRVKVPGGVRPNPHYWLSTANMRLIAGRIAALLNNIAVARGIDPLPIKTASEKFMAELGTLDTDIRSALAGAKKKEFVSAHPVLAYFAREYGLAETASIEQVDGREPGPKDITAITALIKSNGINVIAVTLAEPSPAAESIARDTGAGIVMIEDIGSPTEKWRSSWVDFMRHNAQSLASGLGK